MVKKKKKYNEIWDKFTNTMKIEFYKDPVYDEKYLNTKRSYNAQINTNFHHKKILKEGSRFVCISTILIDFIFNFFIL